MSGIMHATPSPPQDESLLSHPISTNSSPTTQAGTPSPDPSTSLGQKNTHNTPSPSNLSHSLHNTTMPTIDNENDASHTEVLIAGSQSLSPGHTRETEPQTKTPHVSHPSQKSLNNHHIPHSSSPDDPSLLLTPEVNPPVPPTTSPPDYDPTSPSFDPAADVNPHSRASDTRKSANLHDEPNGDISEQPSTLNAVDPVPFPQRLASQVSFAGQGPDHSSLPSTTTQSISRKFISTPTDQCAYTKYVFAKDGTINLPTQDFNDSIIRSAVGTSKRSIGSIGKGHREFELVYDMMVGMRTGMANLEQQEVQAAIRIAQRDQSGLAAIAEDPTQLPHANAPIINPGQHTLHPDQSIVRSPSASSRRLQLQLLVPPPPFTPQPLNPEDFRTAVKQNFTKGGSAYTPPIQLDEFKFKDYCPRVFRAIRHFFGINQIDYINSVCGNAEYIEFLSNSKSGEFFCYSHDFQYMIKTMSKDESLFLREILPAYYEHIMKNPNTLITRFFGMYRVGGRKLAKTHFLLMGSVFFNNFTEDVQFSRVYDLKGSVQGRSVSEREKKRENCVYKDNDFIEHGQKIVLKPHVSKKLREQIKADVTFLKNLQIMDYSLLIGILDLEKQQQYSVPLFDPDGNVYSVVYMDVDTGKPILPGHPDYEKLRTQMELEDAANERNTKYDNAVATRFQVSSMRGNVEINTVHKNPNILSQSVTGKDSGLINQQRDDKLNRPPPTSNMTTQLASDPITTRPATPSLHGSKPHSVTDGSPQRLEANTSIFDASNQSTQPTTPQHPGLTYTFSSQSNASAHPLAFTGSNVSSVTATMTPGTPQAKKQQRANIGKEYQSKGNIHSLNPDFQGFQQIPTHIVPVGCEDSVDELDIINTYHHPDNDDHGCNSNALPPFAPQGSMESQSVLAPLPGHFNATNSQETSGGNLILTSNIHTTSTQPLSIITTQVPADIIVAPGDEHLTLTGDDQRTRARTIVAKDKKAKKDKKDTKKDLQKSGSGTTLIDGRPLAGHPSSGNAQVLEMQELTGSEPIPNLHRSASGRHSNQQGLQVDLPTSQSQHFGTPHPSPHHGQPPHVSSPVNSAILADVSPSKNQFTYQLTGENAPPNPWGTDNNSNAIWVASDLSSPNPPPQQPRQPLDPSHPAPIQTTSLFMTDMGGVRGAGRFCNVIYYIGIIDILTVYNWRKQGETWLKSLRYDKKEISAVSPEYYAERFIEYMDHNVLDIPPEEFKQLEEERKKPEEMLTKKELKKLEEERAKAEKERKKKEDERFKQLEAERKENEKKQKQAEKEKQKEEERRQKESKKK